MQVQYLIEWGTGYFHIQLAVTFHGTRCTEKTLQQTANDYTSQLIQRTRN